MSPVEFPVELLPKLIAETRDELERDGFETHCPMAEKTGGGRVVVCRKAKDFLTVAHDPLAIKMWCSSETGYQDERFGCPIWIGEKEGSGRIERTLAAREDAKVRQETERQIEAGIRVDDRAEEDGVVYQDEHNVWHVVDDGGSDGVA